MNAPASNTAFEQLRTLRVDQNGSLVAPAWLTEAFTQFAAGSISEDRLRELHALGVRGVRFNLVSPAGNRLEGFEAIAAKVEPLGWHVQFLVAPRELAEVAALRERVRVPFVLDHLGGLTGDLAPDGEHERRVLALLARGDCWVKLSGFYFGGSFMW